jgi:hypothetical protein
MQKKQCTGWLTKVQESGSISAEKAVVKPGSTAVSEAR